MRNNRQMKTTAVGLILSSVMTASFAADSAKATYEEVEKMFGSVPSVIAVYPESAVPGGWALMKSTDLNPDTALSPKTKELISLGVASQIPCPYCIYYHTKAATAAGASKEDLREAVLASALVRHWSTILQGNDYDLEAFKAETDGFFPADAAPATARDGIESALVAFVQAYNRGDSAGVATHYTEDAALLPPDAARVNGRDAIQAFWQGAMDAGLSDLTLEAVEVEQIDASAHEVGAFSLSVAGTDGAKTKVEGKYIVVWKRGADGVWRLHRDIWNANPAAAAQ